MEYVLHDCNLLGSSSLTWLEGKKTIYMNETHVNACRHSFLLFHIDFDAHHIINTDKTVHLLPSSEQQ